MFTVKNKVFTPIEDVSRAENNNSKRKTAFTLAEVLITLGIIGVVAALTIPTLMTKYKKNVTAVRVKKAFSELQQAIRLSEAENGEMKEWYIPSYQSIEWEREFFGTYIKPYYTNLRECSIGNDESCGMPVSSGGINYVTSNGTGLSMVASNNSMSILVDINGPQKPNIMGQDVFYFQTTTGKLMPSGWVDGLTREMTLNGYDHPNGYRYSCKNIKTNEDDIYTDARHSCTALLMLDGWEFKDDYPWDYKGGSW